MKNNTFTLYAIRPYSTRGEDDNKIVGNKTFSLHYSDDLSAYEASVIMTKSAYMNIFKIERDKAYSFRKHLSVVRITYIDTNGKRHSIYRRYWPYNHKEDFEGKLAVTTHSFLFLKEGKESILGQTVEVKRSCAFNYYFNHPNEAVRCSFYLGMLSILLGLLSIALAICR